MALLTAETIEPGKFGTPVAFKKRLRQLHRRGMGEAGEGEHFDNILPPGVLNIVNGFGLECGKPLA
jgi:hypothetical protein